MMSFDEKHTWLHLDPNIYYNKTDMTSFVLLTNEQYEQVKKWTLDNMTILHKIEKDAGRCGFSEEDFIKLGVH